MLDYNRLGKGHANRAYIQSDSPEEAAGLKSDVCVLLCVAGVNVTVSALIDIRCAGSLLN